MNLADLPQTRALSAFAKINLTLDVFRKRADGYHSIASILQTISLHDTLHLEIRQEPGISFTCDAPDAGDIPKDATNLAVRAAQSALDAAAALGREIHGGIALHLVKRIPSQAGLGGGSSDAASALIGVDALMDLGLGRDTLRALAADLGSDVPFFLTGGTAAARGRGENITALPDIPPFWVIIVKPEANVSTAWAYGQLDAIVERPSHRATRRMEQVVQEGDRERLIAWQSNDFELPVFANFPNLAWLQDELRMAGALTAHLCGSGAALYGLASDQAGAERIADLLRPRYPYTFVARALSRMEANPLGAGSE